MEDEKALNPDVREMTYGKKVLKKITLYPLSIGDQFKVTNIITEVIQKLVEGGSSGKLSDFVFMVAVMESLETNLGKILELVADIPEDEAKEVISELTNSQLMDIVDSIWTVDYEPALKKGKGLYEKSRKVFDSGRPSPSSSNAIPNTDSKMSTEKATATAD
ncbi:MAG: hypothetical protein WC346_17145 [Methanogenium sp.]|jgi:hypothetical protein